MAIELNNRTKILAGVVVLLAAGAGAWFFFLQDFLNEPPPAPKAAVTAPAKPAADAAKPAEAPKAADAAKADAPKAADAPKTAEAAKPAAPVAAKPIPTNPDQLIAEVLTTSGLKSYFQIFAADSARNAVGGGASSSLGPDAERGIDEALQRVFEQGKIGEESAGALKTGLDAERMARFLEILRQPVSLKMTSAELRNVAPEELKAFSESQRKNPPAAARVKLIQALDGVTRSSEVGSELIGAMARDMVDAMLADLAKAGKKAPPEARKSVAGQLNSIRSEARGQILGILHFMYRNVTDEELGAYVKLLDTDTGRWGTEQLLNAMRPVLTGRFSAFGKQIAPIALANRMGAMAKAPAAEPEPLAKAMTEASTEKPAATGTAATAAAPVEPPGYQRPANIKPLYSRYNDVLTATVMRDRAAVTELLNDGKGANARQADGTTPLMVAVANGDADIATLLLAKGADPNLRSQSGHTALSIARSRGGEGAAMVQLLQRSGAKQ